jgi:glycerophosphoryl diester phosphodiesterase
MKCLFPWSLVCSRAAAVTLLGLTASSCIARLPPRPALNNVDTAQPLVIAHRGASGYRPEHTLAAYALALEQGADFVEPDLVISADGVLIVRHENEIGGTTDVATHAEFASRRVTKAIDGRAVTGWFTEDFTLAELRTLRARERIPQLRVANAQYDGQFGIATFDEVIGLVRDHNAQAEAQARLDGRPAPRAVGIYPETKHPSYFRGLGKPLEPMLVEALHRAGLDSAAAPVFIQSFETGNLRELRRMTKVRLMQLIDAQGAPYDLVAAGSRRSYADLITPAGLADLATYVDGIGAAKELVISRTAGNALGVATDLVRNAHDHGLKVHVWTFRRENVFLPVDFRSGTRPGDSGALDAELDAYLQSGIDGVFSDYPDIAVAARDRRRR